MPGSRAGDTFSEDIWNEAIHTAEGSHHFNVFSPLDSVVPAQEGVLADFSFVKIPVGKKTH